MFLLYSRLKPISRVQLILCDGFSESSAQLGPQTALSILDHESPLPAPLGSIHGQLLRERIEQLGCSIGLRRYLTAKVLVHHEFTLGCKYTSC
jgi:hypothetical protein